VYRELRRVGESQERIWNPSDPRPGAGLTLIYPPFELSKLRNLRLATDLAWIKVKIRRTFV
jgi:hypothetical protein